MARELTDGRRVFLSTLPAGRGERRLALTVVLVSTAIFLTAVPFAKMPLAQISAFIPIYESALVINDLITAVLLFGQFSFLRSRSLCVLASGYLFTALMTDRKSTRLNSSHTVISYAVFCLKKKI